MAKEIKYNADARNAIVAGIDKLADTVRSHWDRRAEMSFWIRNSVLRWLQTMA